MTNIEQVLSNNGAILLADSPIADGIHVAEVLIPSSPDSDSFSFSFQYDGTYDGFCDAVNEQATEFSPGRRAKALKAALRAEHRVSSCHNSSLSAFYEDALRLRVRLFELADALSSAK